MRKSLTLMMIGVIIMTSILFIHNKAYASITFPDDTSIKGSYLKHVVKFINFSGQYAVGTWNDTSQPTKLYIDNDGSYWRLVLLESGTTTCTIFYKSWIYTNGSWVVQQAGLNDTFAPSYKWSVGALSTNVGVNASSILSTNLYSSTDSIFDNSNNTVYSPAPPPEVPMDTKYDAVSSDPDNDIDTVNQAVDLYMNFDIGHDNVTYPNLMSDATIKIYKDDVEQTNYGYLTTPSYYTIKQNKFVGHTTGYVKFHLFNEEQFVYYTIHKWKIEMKVLSTGRTYTIEKNITFRIYIDQNGDGKDDQTQESQPTYNHNGNTPPPIDSTGSPIGGAGAPVRSNYSNDVMGAIEWGFDTFIYYISYPFTKLADLFMNFIDATSVFTAPMGAFSQFLGALFGFLPEEYRATIFLGLVAGTIALIYRVFRGA